MELRIDVKAERVALGGTTLTGQWVDFYAMLALSRAGEVDAPAFVGAEAVARAGPWRHKTVASVGKEIARHLAQLAERGLGDIVEHRGRTRAWRLALAPRALRLRPSRSAVGDWLRARSTGTAGADEACGWVRDLGALVDATVAIQRGDAETALGLAASLSPDLGAVEPALEGWSTLVKGRATHLHEDDDDEALSQLCEEYLKRTDAPSRAVGVRLRTFLALRYRYRDPSATLAALTRLAAELELRGDIGSLGAVLNAMGVLARRAGDVAAGKAHHLRAAALFAIAGDHARLQATLYNVALCHRAALVREGRAMDREPLELVEMCRRVCAQFGVGSDSALAEVAGAHWSLEMGDIAEARRYLKEAEALVARIETTYDQAYFRHVRALIEQADPTGATVPLNDLRSAHTLYLKAGDLPAADDVKRLIDGMSKPGPRRPRGV
ncbi:hypothetical protein AB3662_43660 [Sorangium cellulosum]|uniref:hypothetical protein n=1 Tax=Sorangium cellulosum TaxID=56 RepID=UPI003D9A1311